MSRDPVAARKWQLLFAAWLLALVASLAVLFIGEVMGQTPCNLCWFQRAFMFPLAIVLGMACLRSDAGVWIYALPLALAGALVSGFHTLLYLGVVPEGFAPCREGVSCTSAGMTIFGGIPLPLLSFLVFNLLAASLVAVRTRTSA